MSESNIAPKPIGFQKVGEKIILYSKPCLGKTASTTTLIPCLPEGGRIIYIMTESNSPGGVEFGLKHYNINPKPGQLFYSLIRSKKEGGKSSDLGNLLRATKGHIEGKTMAQKHDAQSKEYNQKEYTFLVKVLENMETLKVKDYITGEEVNLGNIASLSADDVVVIDGLTAIAKEVWNICFGDVVIHTMYDYGPVQKYLANLFAAIERFSCNLILLAHEKEYEKQQRNAKGDMESILDFVGPDTLVGKSNFSVLMSSWAYVLRANKVQGKYVWQVEQDKMFSARREKIQPGENIKLDKLIPDFRIYNFLGANK